MRSARRPADGKGNAPVDARTAAPDQEAIRLLVTNRHSNAHRILAEFTADALSKNHKIYFAIHNNISLDSLNKDLQTLTRETIETHFERGGFQLIHAPDLYLDHKAFSPAQFARRREELCRQARREGYDASNLIVDQGWARDYGLVEELAERSAELHRSWPADLTEMDVCYAEDYTPELLVQQLHGYHTSFFQNGAVSIGFRWPELDHNRKLLTVLHGALVDTSALIKANRDVAFLRRLSAETAYRPSRREISDVLLELVASYTRADMALVLASDPAAADRLQGLAAQGISPADAGPLASAIDEALRRRHAVLSQPQIMTAANSPLLDLLPNRTLRTLVVMPMVDPGSYRGYVLLGSAKASFARDLTHDFLINLADIARTAYRFHDELAEGWSRGAPDRLRYAGEIVGGIAHGFNNLLTVISGSAELLKAAASATTADLSDRILSSVADAADLMDRVRLLVGDEPGPPDLVDVSDAVREVVQLTQASWAADALFAKITVDLDLGDQLRVVMNRAALKEVLRNLLLNAGEALAPAGGRITISAHVQGPHASRVAVVIADTGPGIAENVAQHVFEPFFTTKGQSSRGLGLAIARQWLEKAGGTLTLASGDPGQTQFRLDLPRAQDSAGLAPDGETADLAGARILLVDDDHQVREVLSRLLTLSGGAVTQADGPDAALQLIHQEAWDLAIADLSMPGVSGLEWVRAARRAAPAMPLVMLTGWVDAPLRSEVAAAVDLLLSKPLTAKDVVALANLLGRPPTRPV